MWRSHLLNKFDAIVVGAGTAGCMAAKTVADSGFSVCLIDRKREEDIGKKVCGDAIGKHHFDNLGLKYPKGEELERKIVGSKVYSPDLKTVFSIKGEGVDGFMLNRYFFGQRLLRSAVDAGANVLEFTQVLEPLAKDGFVVGVSARDMKTGKKFGLRGQVVVDASGFSAVLRKRLPPEMGIDANIEKKDVEICYREIRESKEQVADPDFIDLHFSKAIAPGGYYWILPESGTKVNVGLGVAMFDNFPNPKKQLYQHVLSRPLFSGSKVVSAGTWYLPTRRSLECMVGNGIVVVGDVACQTNPIHGGGIGPSMTGGTQAGKTIVEAMENGDVSRMGLWPYNCRFVEEYGAKQAGLDVFRMFLQGLNDDDLNYGMKYRLITEDDLLKTSMGADIRLNITETTLRVFRGLRKLSLLNRLRKTASLLKKVKALYRNYPLSPEGFDEWREKAQALIKSATKIIC